MTFRLNNHTDPAYHLRPNKAVDRLILVDSARHLDRLYPFESSYYIGFGGPYLEDIKLFQGMFPRMRLISIEENEDKYKRQLFHKSSRNVALIHSTFSSYLDNDFPTGQRSIVWLDSTHMNRASIDEFVTVCKNVGENSLVRLTLPASLPQWARGFRLDRDGNPLPKYNTQFQTHSSTYLSPYLDLIPSGMQIQTRDMFFPDFFRLLQIFIRSAIEQAMPSYSLKRFLPIQTSIYSDGVPMISVTGIICINQTIDKIRKYFSRHFTYGHCDWCIPDIIDVPRLSTKERFFLDSKLPKHRPNGKTVGKILKYSIGDDEDDHIDKCSQYEKYFALYPYFERILP